MPASTTAILNDPVVRDALRQALKGAEYAGELVISAVVVYLITPAGQVREVGPTSEILFASEGA